MFRPNRIGTPIIHTIASNVSAASGWGFSNGNGDAAYTGNVINAAPVGDFARSVLHWTGSVAFGAAQKFFVGQQFNISEPLNGDTVGLEMNGSLQLGVPASFMIVPFLGRLSLPGATTLAPVSLQDSPTFFGNADNGAPTGATNKLRTVNYRDIAIVRGATKALVAGTYIHGHVIYDAEGSGFTLSYLKTTYSIRQLNDQQNIGYRDTLR